MADNPEATDPKADDVEPWNDALPREIPKLTAWPAGMALGTTLFFWGIVASPMLVVIGLLVMGASLAGWIGEMRHEP